MDVRDEDVLRALLDVALELTATRSLESLMQVVLRRATELVDAQRALFGVFGADGEEGEAPFTFNIPEGQGELLPISHSLIRRVIEKKETVLVSDVDADQVFKSRGSVRHNGIQFMVGVPVIPSQAPMGVLYIDSQAEVLQDISMRVEVLEIIAGLVATAVDNAFLVDSSQEREREIQSWVHGMRSKVLTIRFVADYLRDETPPERREVGEAIEDLDGASTALTHSLDHVLDLSRLDASYSDDPEVLDVVGEIERHVEQLRPVARRSEHDIAVEFEPGLPRVHTVRSRLGIVLDNLVFNAVKYASADQPVTIRVRERPDVGPGHAVHRRPAMRHRILRRVDNWKAAAGCRFVEVSVHNSGPPIPPQGLAELFVQSRPGEVRHTVRSSGLGLPIADECVRRWGGAIWAESSQEAGTTFAFSLPTHILHTD